MTSTAVPRGLQAKTASRLPLQATALRAAILKNPNFVKKDNRFVQLADLVLYPVAKGKYDPRYGPYQHLIARRKLIDAYVTDPTRLGIKYYCFDDSPTEPDPGTERPEPA